MFSRQCLNRRIPDGATLTRELAALVRRRNEAHATIAWRFTTSAARTTLRHLYPYPAKSSGLTTSTPMLRGAGCGKMEASHPVFCGEIGGPEGRPDYDPEEMEAFLSQPHIAHLATLKGDSSPHLAPLWYQYTEGQGIYSDGRGVCKGPEHQAGPQGGRVHRHARGALRVRGDRGQRGGHDQGPGTHSQLHMHRYWGRTVAPSSHETWWTKRMIRC